VAEDERDLEGVRRAEHAGEIGAEDARLLVPVEAVDPHPGARAAERGRGLVGAGRLPHAGEGLRRHLVGRRVDEAREDAEDAANAVRVAEEEELVLVVRGAGDHGDVGREAGERLERLAGGQHGAVAEDARAVDEPVRGLAA
jgi:hypothetical protein